MFLSVLDVEITNMSMIGEAKEHSDITFQHLLNICSMETGDEKLQIVGH